MAYGLHSISVYFWGQGFTVELLISWHVPLFNFLLAGVRLDARAEADRADRRLRSIVEIVGRDTTSFWSDGARGRVLVLLQERVQQAITCIGSC